MARSPNGENTDPNGDLFGDMGWEDQELTPESRLMLEGITQAFREGRQRLDPRASLTAGEAAKNAREMATKAAAEITERLEELQVRGTRTSAGTGLFTYRDIERHPDFDLAPHLIDDIHYEVYDKRRNKSPSPYLSINLDEILSELTVMRETHVVAVNLQRRQVAEAVKFFQSLKIEEGSVYQAMGTREGRFMIRSMHRLLRERTMLPFVKKFRESVKQAERDEEAPELPEFAARAYKWLETVYGENRLLREPVTQSEEMVLPEFPLEEGQDDDEPASPPTALVQRQLDENDPDELRWYELRRRELERARAFAKPISEYLATLATTETEKK